MIKHLYLDMRYFVEPNEIIFPQPYAKEFQPNEGKWRSIIPEEQASSDVYKV